MFPSLQFSGSNFARLFLVLCSCLPTVTDQKLRITVYPALNSASISAAGLLNGDSTFIKRLISTLPPTCGREKRSTRTVFKIYHIYGGRVDGLSPSSWAPYWNVKPFKLLWGKVRRDCKGPHGIRPFTVLGTTVCFRLKSIWLPDSINWKAFTTMNPNNLVMFITWWDSFSCQSHVNYSSQNAFSSFSRTRWELNISESCNFILQHSFLSSYMTVSVMTTQQGVQILVTTLTRILFRWIKQSTLNNVSFRISHALETVHEFVMCKMFVFGTKC